MTCVLWKAPRFAIPPSFANGPSICRNRRRATFRIPQLAMHRQTEGWENHQRDQCVPSSNVTDATSTTTAAPEGDGAEPSRIFDQQFAGFCEASPGDEPLSVAGCGAAMRAPGPNDPTRIFEPATNSFPAASTMR